MREIKFRAWDKRELKWSFPSIICNIIYELHVNPNADVLEYFDLQQFTGLRDKNGKEIYEGDVVKCHDHPTGVEDVTGVVTYHCGAFMIPGSMMLLRDYGTAWTEVIGNIHQNPELLQS